MTTTLEAFKDEVSKAVCEYFKNEPWFTGVCMDDIEEYYHRDDLAGAIEHAQFETAYWDEGKLPIE